jgi:predicted MFS family arabinose efflux permease
VSEGPFKGWSSSVILAAICVGACLLAAMVFVELRSKHPLIDVRLFGDRLFTSSTAVMILGSICFFGVMFLAALFFQDALGLSALQSGLNTFPEAIGVMVGAQVVTRLLYPVLGPRRVMFIGLVVLTVVTALMSVISTRSELWWMRVLLFLLGYGMAHVFSSAQAAGFATISFADTARASTLFNAVRQLGAAVGVAVVSTVVATIGAVTIQRGAPLPNLEAYHYAFLAASAMSAVGALVSLTVHDADAAATIVRRGRLAARRDAPSAEAVAAR